MSVSHTCPDCFPCKVCTHRKQQLNDNPPGKRLPSLCQPVSCLDIFAAHQVSEAQALAVGASQCIEHTSHMAPANHAHNIPCACMMLCQVTTLLSARTEDLTCTGQPSMPCAHINAASAVRGTLTQPAPILSCDIHLYTNPCSWQVLSLPLTALDLFRDHARYKSLS